jgi:catechol 2,3-dioxygenase-like lactoylglutathione lyase family enzyme
MAAFHHLAIHVRDLSGMEDFYSGLFKLPVIKRWTDSVGAPRSVWLGLDPGFLALELSSFELPQNEPFDDPRGGLLLLAIRIERSERRGWEARLEDRGIAVERRTAFSLFFRDPEGNRLAVSHHPDPVDESA